MKSIKCYYLYQQNLIKNIVIEEFLREKSNYFISERKNANFWIISFPIFLKNDFFKNKLEKSIFYQLIQNKVFKNNQEYSFFILTFNKDFFLWIQLRIGEFKYIQNKKVIISQNFYKFKSFKKKMLKIFKIGRLKGRFSIIQSKNDFSLFQSTSNEFYTNIIIKNF